MAGRVDGDAWGRRSPPWRRRYGLIPSLPLPLGLPGESPNFVGRRWRSRHRSLLEGAALGTLGPGGACGWWATAVMRPYPSMDSSVAWRWTRVGGGCRLASWWRQWRRTCQGSHRWRSSFGVVVASTAEDLPRLSPQSALKMDQWKMAATTHVSASDRFEPRTRQMARSGPPALDVRLR